MNKISREEEKFFDSLIGEAGDFIQCYLGSDISLDSLFEELLLRLANVEEPDRQWRKAFFFAELERVCRDKKTKISGSKDGQLELFAHPQPKLPSTGKKEIGICRARAFINQWNLLNDSVKKEDFILGNERIVVPLMEFSSRLLVENFILDGRLYTEEDHGRHEKIMLYLVELLPESPSVEVEKKCRQDPTWQQDKTRTTKIIRWFETALCSGENTGTIITNCPSPAILSDLRDWLIKSSGKSLNLSEESNTESTMEINSSPDATPQKKDLFLRVFLLVGALASLIGYWGWVERSEKDLKAGKPEKMQDFKVDVVEESSDVDDLTQMAIISAEETANKVLADQISLTLKKMEKEMVVPQPLLEQLQSEKKEVIFQGLDPLIEHASAMEPVIKKDWIDQALSFGSGYLFRPGKESLGKITEVTQLQQKILFKRADWSNPQASFGLSVSDYEVRLGSDSLGFIILVGEVRRQETDTDYGNPPSPVYSLQPSRAWWLDKNQTRTEIDLLSLTEK